MRPSVRLLAATALSALTLATAGAPPAQAAADADVDVLFTFLVAGGAAVDVGYGATCPAGVTATSTVTLTQVRRDGLLARGTDVAEVRCTGSGLPRTQRVTADVTGAPFQRGRAALTMLVTGRDGPACFRIAVIRDARIRVP